MSTNTNPLRFRLNTLFNPDGSIKHGIRCDWPELFVGKQYNGTGNYRCGSALIIEPDHPQFKQVEQAIELAAAEKWKDKAAVRLKGARMKDNVCLRDGALKAAKSEGYEGNFYLTASCKGAEIEEQCVKPDVYDAKRNKITDPKLNPIYRGCYVNALVEVYAMDQYGDQVNCKLVGIQFAADGDAFGSAPARPDDFEDVSAGSDAGEFV